MRVLVYKRTHNGDPDANGCFGAHDCMGKVRSRHFDAVIGVGGIGPEAQANGIAGKVNWIGIRPHKRRVRGKRGPNLLFDQFLDYGTDGPDFRELAPTLAQWMYSNNVRYLLPGIGTQELAEAIEILGLAVDAPPSPGRDFAEQRTRPVPRCVARPRTCVAGAGRAAQCPSAVVRREARTSSPRR